MDVFGETRASGWLGTAVTLVLRALAPPRCAACEQPLGSPSVFCAPCAATVVREPHHDLAFGQYGGALAEAINRFKHGDRPDLARPLGDLLRRVAAERQAEGAPLAAERLVPVPLHPLRLAARRYNPAALLARELAATLRIPVDFDTLERVTATRSQQGLGGAARRRNVAGAFRATRRLAGRIILIDDVRTTGATLAACAAPLRAAGATSVQAVVLARAQLD